MWNISTAKLLTKVLPHSQKPWKTAEIRENRETLFSTFFAWLTRCFYENSLLLISTLLKVIVVNNYSLCSKYFNKVFLPFCEIEKLKIIKSSVKYFYVNYYIHRVVTDQSQCAAVTIHSFPIITPPHLRWSFKMKTAEFKDTCHGFFSILSKYSFTILSSLVPQIELSIWFNKINSFRAIRKLNIFVINFNEKVSV